MMTQEQIIADLHAIACKFTSGPAHDACNAASNEIARLDRENAALRTLVARLAPADPQPTFDANDMNETTQCYWCRAELESHEDHAPNCPWLAAQAVVEGKEGTNNE